MLGVTNVEAFKRDAKRFGCLFEKSGIVKIDVEKFQLALDAEFAKAAEAASRPVERKRGPSSDLGLVNARLAQHDTRRHAKLEKITAIKAAITSATTVYERGKLQRDLTKAEAELQRLDDGHQRDLKRRDEILNGDSSVREAA
ncbi:MAG: hypothetical protein PHI18_07220 [bacterium]|nr:hypothetical protein [bacterium]